MSLTAAAPSIQAGRLLAGQDPDALVARYGSPLFVYDAAVVRARVAALRAALPVAVEIAFATKANPSPLVLATLAQAGLGADVASAGELRAVLRAGFPPERVVFTGPGKTDAELEMALRAGIGALTLESIDELEALLGMRGLARPGKGLLLRLATVGSGEETPIIAATGQAKFGLSDEEADEALGWLRQTRAVAPAGPFRVRGFHAFGASNVRGASVLVAAAGDLARRAERLAARHDLDVELLDSGGGLGIAYADDEAELDLGALGDGLAAELATWAGRPILRRTRLLLEPGRWLTGPAGAYICRVVRTKVRDGRHVAITDGGIHHLLRPRLVGQDQRVVAVGRAAERPADASVDVVGPLCTGLDILAAAVRVPAPRPGDLLAVLDAGAYGFSESMPFFLSHPIPAEVVLDDGQVVVSRERIEPA